MPFGVYGSQGLQGVVYPLSCFTVKQRAPHARAGPLVPIGFVLTLLAGAAVAMAAVGLFFWAVRWFPRQRWLAPTIVLVFLFLVLLARHTKWGIPLIGFALLIASAFIPRRR